MRSTHFLGLVKAEIQNDKSGSLITSTTAHYVKVFRVFEERADLDARRLGVVRAV